MGQFFSILQYSLIIYIFTPNYILKQIGYKTGTLLGLPFKFIRLDNPFWWMGKLDEIDKENKQMYIDFTVKNKLK